MYKAGKQSLVQTRNPRFLDKEWLHRSGVFKLEKDTTDIYMTVNDKEKIYKKWFIISPMEAQDSNTVMKRWIKN